MLALKNHPATLAHFTPRGENHGADVEPAGTMKLQFNIDGALLEHFDTSLREAMFRQPLEGEQQELLSPFSKPRFQKLKPFGWKEEFTGYQIEVGSELGLSDALHLVDVMLKEFTFQALEGRSVEVVVKASAELDEQAMGFLGCRIKKEVAITLIPPVKADEPVASNVGSIDLIEDPLTQAADNLAA